MKKLVVLAVVSILATLPIQAQSRFRSNSYSSKSRTFDNGRHRGFHGFRYNDVYYGFRIGPSFTTVNSDDKYLDGGTTQTGLNVGFAAGFALATTSPLYFETGLYYHEKGGKGNADGSKFTYNLNYMEMPLVLKYIYDVAEFSIQPYMGGYVACGVGGKIKDFGKRQAYDSFSDTPYSFRRFDGGLKFGCGMAYDMFYVDLSYDLGLANVCHDDFDTSKNSALNLTFGINF